MEEDDELVPAPDGKGTLNLSNRAWVNLDPIIWTMSSKVIKLDLSYNHIVEIPSLIGEMVMLRELIASFNKIIRLPPELGRLKRLRRLLLNSNRIKIIPPEVGQLEMLEELIISENSIEEIPVELSSMSNLKVLKMCNNRLKALPFELADLVTLEVLDCANNPQLDIVPATWRGDTESMVFICKVHSEYNVRMREMVQSNIDLSKHSQLTEQENLVMRERVTALLAKIDELNHYMPKKVAKRMEQAAKLAAEQEMAALNKDDKKSCCVIC